VCEFTHTLSGALPAAFQRAIVLDRGPSYGLSERRFVKAVCHVHLIENTLHVDGHTRYSCHAPPGL